MKTVTDYLEILIEVEKAVLIDLREKLEWADTHQDVQGQIDFAQGITAQANRIEALKRLLETMRERTKGGE